MFKKTIILNGAGSAYKKTSQCDIKGLISFSRTSFGCNIEMKLFNVARLSAQPLLLIKVGDIKLEQKAIQNLEHFKCEVDRKLDLSQPILVAVGIVMDGKLSVIAHGKSDVGISLKDVFDDYSDLGAETAIEKLIDDTLALPEDAGDSDSGVATNVSAQECTNCPYKVAFFNENTEQDVGKLSSAPPKEDRQSKLEPILPKATAEGNDVGNFYMLIEPQLKELFSRFTPETRLGELIEGSEWVRVDYGNEADYYVVGKLKDNNVVTHICYGVPAKNRGEPPKQMEGFCQWLPLSVEQPNGDGYWMMYQDALSGNNISFEII